MNPSPCLLLRALACVLTMSVTGLAAPIPDHDAAGVPREVRNFLSNGDFEISSHGLEWPDDWTRPSAGLAEWNAREDNAHYVLLRATAPGQTVLMYRSMPVPKGVDALEVTVRARVTGLKRGQQVWHDARVMLEFRNVQNVLLKPSPKPIVFTRDTDDWVVKSVTVQVPSGAQTLEVMPTLFQVNEGTLEMEYILVAPARPAPLVR